MNLNASTPSSADHDAALAIVDLSSASTGGLKRAHSPENDDSSVPEAKRAFTEPEEASKTEDEEQNEPSPPNPFPYFFYTDHSLDLENAATPVTDTGSISFPMKLHAILAKPELSEIVAWDTHGRSFRILKQGKFETEVLAKYFGHSKFASFTRQLNGWSFRRLAEGENRSSYYDENFLRSMPWLTKKMGRPKSGEKKCLKKYEPDLVAISKEHPLPNYPMTHEVQVIIETIEKGPKAKMPKFWNLVEDSKQSMPTQGPAFLALLRSIQENESKPKARAVPQAEPLVNMAFAANAAVQQHTAQTQRDACLARLQSLQPAAQPPPSNSNQNGSLSNPFQGFQQNRLTAAAVQPTALMQRQDTVMQNLVQSFNQAGQVQRQISLADICNVAAANPDVAALLQQSIQTNQFNQAGQVQRQSSFADGHPVTVNAIEAALAAELLQAIEVNKMLEVVAASEGLAAVLNQRNGGIPQNHNGISHGHNAAAAAATAQHMRQIPLPNPALLNRLHQNHHQLNGSVVSTAAPTRHNVFGAFANPTTHQADFQRRNSQNTDVGNLSTPQLQAMLQAMANNSGRN